MSTLLVRNATLLITMDDARRKISDGALFTRDNIIEQVGPTTELASLQADRVIDATGRVVLPGLVNTHHHLYQTLTRAVPAAQNVVLFRNNLRQGLSWPLDRQVQHLIEFKIYWIKRRTVYAD